MNNEELTYEQVEALRQKLILEGKVPMPAIKAAEKKSVANYNKWLRSEGLSSDKEYVGLDIAFDAYWLLLASGCSPLDALTQTAQDYGMDSDWVGRVKNNKFYYAKEVVAMADNIPEQKVMSDNGTLHKPSLNKASSVNNQLRTLHGQKKLSDTLERLKEDNKNTKKTVALHEADLEGLKQLTGMQELSPKERATILKQKGWTQEEIATAVGKTSRTIKRWWSDL